MSDPQQAPRLVEGKDVIYQCRGAGWSAWSLELLDQAYKAKCRLRKTATHHVMISNDAGMTTTLAGRNSSNGARSRRDTMKVIKGQEEYNLRQAMNDPDTPEPKPEPPAFNPPPEDLEVPEQPAFEVTAKPSCPLHDPPRVFDTERKLENHRTAEHWQCPQCHVWLKSPKSAGGHVGVKHGDNKPWESKANFKGNKAPAGTVDELLDDLRRGAPSRAPLIPQPPRQNSNGTRRPGSAPVRTVELPEPSALALVVADADKLHRIREVLGEDPRIAALQTERDNWQRRAETAETKVQMMKAAAAQMTEAADL